MNYFITGSHIYGPLSDDSDLDIVMMRDEARKIWGMMELVGIEITRKDTSNRPRYFQLGILNINIIGLETELEYEAWKYATDEMKKLAPCYCRKTRHWLFEKFVDEYMRMEDE